MTASVDVAILGGGPAGAAAAIGLAARGLEAVVMHAQQGAYGKTVETLPPPARPLLEHVGVWDHLAQDGHFPVYGTRSRWGSDRVKETSYVFHPHGHGWRLDRPGFDARLRQIAIDCGVGWHDGREVTEVARKDGGWEVHWRQADRSGKLNARYLADATGRSAWLANRQGVKRFHDDRLVAFAARIPIEAKTNQATTLVEAVEHGWWYSIDLPSVGQREVVFYTDHDLPAAKLAAASEGWMQLFERTTETSAGPARGPLEKPPRVIGSRSGVLGQSAGDGWLAVGDAAVTEDPLASNGLVTALKSGLEGAAVVADQLASKSNDMGSGYARRVSMNHDASMTLRIAYYRMEPRWRSSPFWARRQQMQSHSAPAAL